MLFYTQTFIDTINVCYLSQISVNLINHDEDILQSSYNKFTNITMSHIKMF